MLDAVSVTVVGERREGVGTRVAVRSRLFGVPAFTEILEVVRWDPPAALDVAHSGLLRGVGRWRLSPDAGGTRFEWEEEVRLAIPLIGEAAAWLYRPILRRLMRRAIERLAASLSRPAARPMPRGRASAPRRGRTDASARRRSSRAG